MCFDDGTAASATLTALGGSNGGLGGLILIQGAGNGANARVIAEGNGTVTIAGLNGSGTTFGSIAGSGGFLLGAKNLAVGSNNTSTVVSGSISGVGGTLTKVGTDTLTISAVQSYSTLNANGGTTILESALGSGSSTLNVNATAEFRTDQKLAALNIGPDGVATLTDGAPLMVAGLDVPAPTHAIPEPTALSLLLIAFFGLVRRLRPPA